MVDKQYKQHRETNFKLIKQLHIDLTSTWFRLSVFYGFYINLV